MTDVDRVRVPVLHVPIPARENVHAKSLRLLVTGRVRIKLVRAGRCWATVNGDTATHAVGCAHGRWFCDCKASPRCAHIEAVRQLVDLSGPNTGGDTA